MREIGVVECDECESLTSSSSRLADSPSTVYRHHGGGGGEDMAVRRERRGRREREGVVNGVEEKENKKVDIVYYNFHEHNFWG